MTDPTDAQVAAFKEEWGKAHNEGDKGNRVRRGLRAARAVEASDCSEHARDAVTDDDEWGSLAQFAEAATPGPWRADDEHGLFGPGTIPAWTVSRTDADERFLGDVAYMPQAHAAEARADAEFIAAANPATILRLISALREARVEAPPCDGGCDNFGGPDEYCSRHGRPVSEVWGFVGDLSARLAGVEALADEWERRAQLAETTADARAGLSDENALRQHADLMSNRAEDLRAALATDTTKEN